MLHGRTALPHTGQASGLYADITNSASQLPHCSQHDAFGNSFA